MFIPDLVLGCSVGWAGAVAAGMEVVVLLPGTWAASRTGLSQDLSAPDLAPGYSVGWVELASSHWETNCCVFLPRDCLHSEMRLCGTTLCVCWQWVPMLDLCPAVHVLTMSSEVWPRPQPRPSGLSPCR